MLFVVYFFLKTEKKSQLSLNSQAITEYYDLIAVLLYSAVMCSTFFNDIYYILYIIFLLLK